MLNGLQKGVNEHGFPVAQTLGTTDWLPGGPACQSDLLPPAPTARYFLERVYVLEVHFADIPATPL